MNCNYVDIEIQFQLERRETDMNSAITYIKWYQCPKCYSKAIVETLEGDPK
jgi:hypothetical protein